MIPLGGLDALVFTGGIGEKSRIKREKILGNVFSMRINFQSIIGDDDQAVVKKKTQSCLLSSESWKILTKSGTITNQESKSHLPNYVKPISTDLLSPLGVTYNKEQNLTNGGKDGTLGGEKVKVGD